MQTLNFQMENARTISSFRGATSRQRCVYRPPHPKTFATTYMSISWYLFHKKKKKKTNLKERKNRSLKRTIENEATFDKDVARATGLLRIT